MKQLLQIIVFLGMGLTVRSQFTFIPTGTSTDITSLSIHGDTLVISGRNNYFAKSHDMGTTIMPLSPPGPVGYFNHDLQVINNNYYILSVEGIPYEHNYILKSADYGATWNTLYDTIGLFYTLTMLDTAFGIMGGAFGSYAMTQGSDTAWALDSLYSLISASEAYGDSTMLMMSFGSMCYITENRGQTWTWVSGTSYQHEEIQFVNKDTIYAVAHKGTTNPSSYFYYSTNGGYNWSTVKIGFNDSLGNYDYYSRIFDLYFDSPQHGYIIGYNYDINQAIILETNDYGLNWTMNPTGITDELYDILNINDSIAFIGGENGTLLKWNKFTPMSVCDVTLSATAASCVTCCDACITATPSGDCPPYTLQWAPNDPNTPPCSACWGTTYTVTVTDNCGCTVVDSITPDTVPVGIDETGQQPQGGSVNVYPNPATSQFTISGITEYPAQFTLFDLTGRVVKQAAIENKQQAVDVSHLPKGLYVWQLGAARGKVVIE